MVKKTLLIILFFSVTAGINYPAPALTNKQEDPDSLFQRLIAELEGGRQTLPGNTPGVSIAGDEKDFSDDERLHNIKCGFSARASARVNYGRFTPSQQLMLNVYLSRPVLQKSIVSPSGFFRIHYDETGINAPSYVTGLSAEENARLVAEAYDSSYSFEVDFLGFDPPPSDDLAGGDGKYDVYIMDLPEYGSTTGENEVSPGHFASFVQMHNSFSGIFATRGIDGARVTAAHEFHHAIQFGSYSFKDEDRYFYELTSTSMEEFVYDSINDYYAYMRTYFNNPNRAFSSFRGYDMAIWNIFLQIRYGYDIFRRQWDLYLQMPVLSAINQSLIEKGSSFREAFNEFGVWSYFTGYKSDPIRYFPEGRAYPMLRGSQLFSLTLNQQNTLNMQPASNNFLRCFGIRPGSFTDTIVSVITNADIAGANADPSQLAGYKYGIFNNNEAHSRPLGAGYYSLLSADVSMQMFFDETVIINDSTSHIGIIMGDTYAYPNPFGYNLNRFGSEVFLPVEYSGQTRAELNVYTSGMELVYSSEKDIKPKFGKVFVPWNGLDSKGRKLPSGVYIYVTNSNDKITRGKIVIINE